MPAQEEDRALVSLVAGHVADALPYIRQGYFVELFPVRTAEAAWLKQFVEQNGILPSPKQFRRHFPGLDLLQRPEPLAYCMSTLRDGLSSQVVGGCGQKINEAYQKDDYTGLVEIAEKMLAKLSIVRSDLSSGADTPESYHAQRLADFDKDAAAAIKVIPSLYDPLNTELGGGYHPGQLYTLSALISLGKTYVSLAEAVNQVRLGYRVLFVSLEMSRADIMNRALCLMYELDVDHYLKFTQPKSSLEGGETPGEWRKRALDHIADLLKNKPLPGKLLVIGSDLGMINERTIRSYAKEHDVSMVFIDAAQDLRDNSGTKDRTQGLYNALMEVNSMANVLKVPVMFTVQLQAEVEQKGLTKGNLTRIAWGQVFAQKSAVVITMLGDRATLVRDMRFEKTRDGQPGTPWQLQMHFPKAKLSGIVLQPTGIDFDTDLDAVETFSDLQKALADEPATDLREDDAPPPPVRTPSKIVPQEDSESPSSPGPSAPLTPYQRKMEEKLRMKKLKDLRKGRK